MEVNVRSTKFHVLRCPSNLRVKAGHLKSKCPRPAKPQVLLVWTGVTQILLIAEEDKMYLQQIDMYVEYLTCCRSKADWKFGLGVL